MRGGAQREHRLQPALELLRGEAGAGIRTSLGQVCLHFKGELVQLG